MKVEIINVESLGHMSIILSFTFHFEIKIDRLSFIIVHYASTFLILPVCRTRVRYELSRMALLSKSSCSHARAMSIIFSSFAKIVISFDLCVGNFKRHSLGYCSLKNTVGFGLYNCHCNHSTHSIHTLGMYLQETY